MGIPNWPPTSWLFESLGDDSAVTFTLSRPSGDVEVAGMRRTADDGTLDGSTLGSADAVLNHVVVHWMNLPDVQRRQHRWRSKIGGSAARLARTWRVTAQGGLEVLDAHTQSKTVVVAL